VVEFLGAATGTMATCLEWTLAHLVARPEIQTRLRREVDGASETDRNQLRSMPYLHAVVLESLRMHPPVPFVLRQVDARHAAPVVGKMTTTVVQSEDDSFLQFAVGSIGRDKKTWSDPDEFRPERFMPGGEGEGVGPLPGPKEIRMMPFGAGHRFCPGMGMAMANIKCFLAALVREFEWMPCYGRVDLTEQDKFFKFMKTPLCVRVTRRK
jgi:cytochrome P450